MTPEVVPAFIPSPGQGVWHLGPIPIRAYALSILAGVVVAWWWALRRWKARGGTQDAFEGMITWALVFGIIGARLYHVATDYQLYFGPGRDWWRLFFIWEGGLGVWGAVAGGALAVWWQARRRNVRFSAIADTVAPTILVAQAFGRLGNWFNQELYGRPTTLPWALEIDPVHRLPGYEANATYHPTFLYEIIWCLAMAALLVWAEKRFSLGRGKAFTLYVALYTLGRFFIESLRIDPVNTPGGFRLNNYTSVIVFVAAVALFVWLVKNRPGTDSSVWVREPAGETAEPDEEPAAEAADGEAEAEGEAPEVAEPDAARTDDSEGADPR